jgi:hypothetical protein
MNRSPKYKISYYDCLHFIVNHYKRASNLDL